MLTNLRTVKPLLEKKEMTAKSCSRPALRLVKKGETKSYFTHEVAKMISEFILPSSGLKDAVCICLLIGSLVSAAAWMLLPLCHHKAIKIWMMLCHKDERKCLI